MIRRFLIGRRCVLCRQPLGLKIPEKAKICPVCAEKVRKTYRCDKNKAIPYSSGTSSIFWYQGLIRKALVGAKFYHRVGALAWLSEHLSARVLAQQDTWRADCITFVPMPWTRKWLRGFNQSEFFAKHAAKRCGLPCVACLGRRAFSKRQSGMKTTQARKQNAQKTFFPRKGIDLTGKRIVLIDDILTTGSTLAVCAQILREQGAAEVYIVTAAQVPERHRF